MEEENRGSKGASGLIFWAYHISNGFSYNFKTWKELMNRITNSLNNQTVKVQKLALAPP